MDLHLTVYDMLHGDIQQSLKIDQIEQWININRLSIDQYRFSKNQPRFRVQGQGRKLDEELYTTRPNSRMLKNRSDQLIIDIAINRYQHSGASTGGLMASKNDSSISYI